MTKYIKKPVAIEALEWTGENHREMNDFLGGDPEGGMSAYGDNFYIQHSKIKGGLVIKTLEGEHLASIGDFIIKGVQGEFYPCKPDIFKQTYYTEAEYAELTMMITCINNEAFEDSLTKGKQYKILATGENGFLIKDDKGEEKDYGAMKIKYVRNDV